MPRRRNTWWALVTTSRGRPNRSRRGTRRSRCTRISAEVRDSAALIARVIASKSASLRNCCVQLGCLAITSPVALSPVPHRHHQLPLAPPPPELPPPPKPPPPHPAPYQPPPDCVQPRRPAV